VQLCNNIASALIRWALTHQSQQQKMVTSEHDLQVLLDILLGILGCALGITSCVICLVTSLVCCLVCLMLAAAHTASMSMLGLTWLNIQPKMQQLHKKGTCRMTKIVPLQTEFLGDQALSNASSKWTLQNTLTQNLQM